MNGPFILGLSGLTHDPAAALIGEKGVVAAIEESKLVRSREISGIPRAAIGFCLERAGIHWKDICRIAVASRPHRVWLRQAWLRMRLTPMAPVASGYYQSRAIGDLGRELNNARILRSIGQPDAGPLQSLEHHLCHAASAFYASPFDRALIVTLDEQGDGWSGSVSLGEGAHVRLLRTIPFPHSLGWVYSQVTDLLGHGREHGEHKTQWLSLVGEPEFAALFVQMLRCGQGPLPHIDRSYFNSGLAGRIAFSKKFYRAVGLDPRKPLEIADAQRPQLAASVQEACTAVAAGLAEAFRQRTGSVNLCLAGGLFLNPLLVSEVEKRTGFNSVFVQPAAGNEGTSLGAAWLARHQQLQKPRVEPIIGLDWGPNYSNQEIKCVLDNCKTRYRWHNSEDEKVEEAVRLFAAGKIVAWFHGAAEFGPRALGNRSLMASPWAPYVKENLNEFVKHREVFRPFAISMPEEDSARYVAGTPAARFMTTLGRVRPEARELLRDFLLPGDRVRLHVVERRANPTLWKLLKRWGEQAPAPILVNTSFNLFGEPLVITPRDAVRSFFCSGIDAMMIGNFSLSKA